METSSVRIDKPWSFFYYFLPFSNVLDDEGEL